MKARKVKRLDPEATLVDNAERIIRVRLDELCSFVPRALDPAETEALHDMRIAAKRLRYLLELTSFCFGPYAARAARHARELQDLLGEIHDCDVMQPLVLEHVSTLRSADAAIVRARAGGAKDLDPALAPDAPNADAYRGLQVLAVHLEARRELLFVRFRRKWQSLERSDFQGALRRALAERPVPAGDTA